MEQHGIGNQERDKHKRKHKLLHKYFDELLADFIAHNPGPVFGRTVLDVAKWSHAQCENPYEIDWEYQESVVEE